MDNNNNNEELNSNKSKLPTHIFLPSFLNKDMPIGTFFISAGALSVVGFGVGLLIGFRKSGGIKQTIRSSPPGAVMAATKALLGGTAICAGFTTALVYFLKAQYNIKTVKDFGDLMRGKQDQQQEITLIDERTFLEKQAQLNNNNNGTNQDDNNITDLNQMDKESLEALKALKYLPFDFTNQNQNNNNNNNQAQDNTIDIGINDNNNNNNNNNSNK